MKRNILMKKLLLMVMLGENSIIIASDTATLFGIDKETVNNLVGPLDEILKRYPDIYNKYITNNNEIEEIMRRQKEEEELKIKRRGRKKEKRKKKKKRKDKKKKKRKELKRKKKEEKKRKKRKEK